MGIGTLEVHPIDLLGAYGTIANGGVRMPRQMITDGRRRRTGGMVWPLDDDKPEGTEVISPQAAYIITDILAGNTDTKVNPFWGKFAIYDDGTRRPAAYKTGTTNDNRDVARLRLPRPAEGQGRARPSRSASGWATATTPRTTASSRSTPRRRCGRRS